MRSLVLSKDAEAVMVTKPYRFKLADMPRAWPGTGQDSADAPWRFGESEGGARALPSHLWSHIALYHGPLEACKVLQGSQWLRVSFDVDTLWRAYAVESGIVRLASTADPVWAHTPLPTPGEHSGIDWRRLLRLDRLVPSKHHLWVRVFDTDLRLPVAPEQSEDVDALSALLGGIIAGTAGAPSARQLASAGASGAGRPVSWPLRLRAMQFGGRPGELLGTRAPLAGARALVEWALPDWKSWPLPPHGPARPIEEGVSGPKQFLAWLLCTHAPIWTAEVEPVASNPKALLRVFSPLLTSEVWMEVDREGTLGALCADVGRMLQRESWDVADRRVRVELVGVRPAQGSRAPVALPEPEDTPLSELFWARSETVWAEAVRSEAGSRGPVVVRLFRERGLGGEEAEREARAAAAALAEAAMPDHWRRQVSDPLACAARQRAPSALPAVHDAWARQCTIANDGGPPVRGVPLPAAAQPLSTQEEVAFVLTEEEGGDMDLSPRSGGGGSGSGSADDHQREGSQWELIVPHSPPRILAATSGTRQFEFHPTTPEMMLVGDKKGTVNVIDIGAVEGEVHPPLRIGSCPMLALVWMRQNPQVAICGESSSGEISVVRHCPQAYLTEPALRLQTSMEAFSRLSSLSVNCTDDFLLASGISTDLAIYDMQSGRVLQRAFGIHEHFINISRFCHLSPHIFATASFDDTCKIWDLRQPLTREKSVKTLHTGGHNVMCAFSPDDRLLLCTGIDTKLTQFEIPSWRKSPDQFPLREAVHSERYRRSAYLAGGLHIATAATEESHMHVLSVTGEKLGVVDFDGAIHSMPLTPLWPLSSATSGLRRSPFDRFAFSAPADVRCTFPCMSPSRTPGAADHCRVPMPSGSPPGRGRMSSDADGAQQLMQGVVQLQDSTPPGEKREYVQSVRGHPTMPERVGVLLALTEGDASYVALVDLKYQ